MQASEAHFFAYFFCFPPKTRARLGAKFVWENAAAILAAFEPSQKKKPAEASLYFPYFTTLLAALAVFPQLSGVTMIPYW